jgi:hypothetical protein
LFICELLILNSNAIVMQDLDPSRRPGAGPDGYAILKIHPFFKGVDWNNLRAQTPPKLALEPGVRHPLLCSFINAK